MVLQAKYRMSVRGLQVVPRVQHHHDFRIVNTWDAVTWGKNEDQVFLVESCHVGKYFKPANASGWFQPILSLAARGAYLSRTTSY